MINDERRREVARNLRKLVRLSGSGSCHATSICNALGLIDENRYAPSAYYCGDSVMHLADLIEPEPERTCQMDKSEFADFATEYEGLYSCTKCGEETAVLACVNEDGDMEWMKPRFCGFCGAKVVEVVDE